MIDEKDREGAERARAAALTLRAVEFGTGAVAFAGPVDLEQLAREAIECGRAGTADDRLDAFLDLVPKLLVGLSEGYRVTIADRDATIAEREAELVRSGEYIRSLHRRVLEQNELQQERNKDMLALLLQQQKLVEAQGAAGLDAASTASDLAKMWRGVTNRVLAVIGENEDLEAESSRLQAEADERERVEAEVRARRAKSQSRDPTSPNGWLARRVADGHQSLVGAGPVPFLTFVRDNLDSIAEAIPGVTRIHFTIDPVLASAHPRHADAGMITYVVADCEKPSSAEALLRAWRREQEDRRKLGQT
jgi:hypothetical protein